MTIMDSLIEGPREFWRAIGCRAVGVAVVTTQSAEGPTGFLALSATHLSASPPVMMVSLDAQTSAGADLLASGSFCINYLTRAQKPLAERFFAKDGPKGAERFKDLAMAPMTTGAPAITGSLGVLDCALEEVITRHGTMILLGRLIDARSDTSLPPLLSFAGQIS